MEVEVVPSQTTGLIPKVMVGGEHSAREKVTLFSNDVAPEKLTLVVVDDVIAG